MQLKSEGLKAVDVDSVEIFVHPLVLELTGKKFPKDGLEAKFSVYHGAAGGLLFGEASPAQYTDDAVHETAELRKKIIVTVDKSVEADACLIIVHMSKGRVEKRAACCWWLVQTNDFGSAPAEILGLGSACKRARSRAPSC